MTNKQIYFENLDKVENLSYIPLEKKYLRVLFIKTILSYLVLMGLVLLLLLAEGFDHRLMITVCIEFVLLVVLFVNLLLLPKIFANKGFAIREHDITYRSGIIFLSVTSIPFCKIQQVSIRQNPLSRIFGLYVIDIVNGAQLLSEISIPGLTEERANEIKASIIERMKYENQ